MMNRFLLSAVLLTAFIAAGSENLIPQADLKTVPGAVLPKGWRAARNANAKVVDPGNGKRAVELTTSKNGKQSYVVTSVKIAAGKLYRMTCTVQGKAGTKGRVYIESSSPWQGVGPRVFTCTGKPQKISFDVKFKPFKKQPYLALRLDSAGWIRFSDLTLTQSSLDLVRNAKFNGLTHWSKHKNAEIKQVNDAQKGSVLQLTSLGKAKVFAIQRDLPLTAGTDYRFSVEVKGKKGTKVSAYIENSKPWKTFSVKPVTCNGKWQRISFEFNFPVLQRKPYLVLRVNDANGQALFADPRIEVAGGKFRNGDFEQGSSGWQLNSGRIISTRTKFKNRLELQNFKGKASAVQTGIVVKKGQAYRISYRVRGGNDKRYTDAQNATWFRIAARMDGKLIPGTEIWKDVYTAWHNKSAVFRAEKDGRIDIVCELRDPGTVQFDNIVFAPTNAIPAPVEIVLGLPYGFRESALAGSKAPVTGRIICNISGVARRQLSFNGRTLDLSGETFSLPVPEKIGKYPLAVTVFDKKGRVLAKNSIEFSVREPAFRKITFTKDRIMLIDDMPFFPIGVWSVRGSQPMTERLKIIAQNGFNIARLRSENIDDAAENGLLAMIRVPEKIPAYTSPRRLRNWINNVRLNLISIQDHPSLVGYYNSDEPAWRGQKPEDLIKSYKLIRSIDPDRPIFLNEAPRGAIEEIRIFSEASDIYGVDIYPVPPPHPHSGLADKNLTAVGKYTDICRAVVRDTQPVWMTLQAFAWGAFTKRERVYPTPDQSRFMAYNAIAHGATGLFYWGINNGYENWDFVNTLGITIKELRRMTSVFVSPTVTPAEISADKKDINIMQKKVNGRNYYIVLNEGPGNHQVKFSGKLPAELYVLTEKRSITPVKGSFSDTFKPYSVHVYSETPEPPAPLPAIPTRRMQKKIELGDDFKKANWIWYPNRNMTAGHRSMFFRGFKLDALPVKAELFATGDDFFRLWLNGKLLIEHFGNNRTYNIVSSADVTKLLKKGGNSLAIKAIDSGTAPCGMIFMLRMTMADGSKKIIVSDAATLASEKVPAVWPPVNTDKNWVPAQVLGRYGSAPWVRQSHSLPALSKFSKIFPY